MQISARRSENREVTRLTSDLRAAQLSRTQQLLINGANLLVFFMVWELVARFGGVPSLILPPFTEVLAAGPSMIEEGILFSNLWVSLRNFLIGLSIAITFAVPAGLVVGTVRVLQRLIEPYVWVFYTLPRLVLMPIILIWFGLSTTSRIILVVISAIPAIMVFVMDGAKNTDASLLRAARSFTGSRNQLLTKVVLPATLPFVASGVKLGVARGLVGLFIGEFFTAQNGIGYLLLLSSREFDTPRTFFVLILFIVFSVSLIALGTAIEARASRWRPV